MNFVLLRPWWLLALLPLGLVLWRLWSRSGAEPRFWQQVVDVHLQPHVLRGTATRSRRNHLALVALVFLLSVLALAGPALTDQPQPVLQRDLLRVLVVDMSGQADSPQQAETFLAQARIKVRALLRAFPSGQNALIVYGGEPYLVVPPTTDSDTIAHFVPELAPDALPVSGNQPGYALRMAQKVLERSALREHRILWITSADDALIPLLPALTDARLSILHGAAGEAPGLAEYARRSGGTLVKMRADDSDVRHLVADAAAQERWLAEIEMSGQAATDIGYWLLLLLLPLAALAFRGGLRSLLLLPLLVSSLSQPQPAVASDFSVASDMANMQGWVLLATGHAGAAAKQLADPRWRAVACYRAGDFAEAARLLEGLEDAESLYNRGNALARMGRYADALAVYERSLALRVDEDARHNRDLMRRLLPPPKRAGGRGGRGGSPPAASAASNAQREADRIAEQWLRGVPDEPATLLQRKLRLEQRRREAGKSERAW